MIKKSFPIKKPFLYDTKEGIDYITKLSIEDNPKKLTAKELTDIHNLGKDMKKSALEDHIKTVKQFDNHDPSTYPSRPEVRGKLLEIDKLEKDLAPPKLTNLPIVRNNINTKPRSRTGNPSGRDYWKEFVALNTGNNGERKLPVVSPEDRNQPRMWEDVIYPSMTMHEKGTWNREQRKKKEEQEKEAEQEKTEAELTPAKMAKEVVSDALNKIEIPRVRLPEAREVRRQPERPLNLPLPELHRKNESGIHEGFVREKLREGEILKQVEKEIKNEI